MANLEELKERRDHVRAYYEEALATYEAALLEMFPFRVGDVIRSKVNQLAKVVSRRVEGDRVYMRGVYTRRNGEWSERVMPLYPSSWNDATLVERPLEVSRAEAA